MTPWKKSNMLLREHEDGNYVAYISYNMTEDSYEEGEVSNGKSWVGEFYIEGSSISEIFYELNTKYGTSRDSSDWEQEDSSIDSDEDDTIISNTEVNKYMDIPSEEEWEEFKKGELHLFIMDIWMQIFDIESQKYLSYKEITDEYFYELHSVEEEEDSYDEGFDDIEESVKRHR